MSVNMDRVAAFARELADVATRELQAALGLPPEQATEIGFRVAQQACDEFAGQLIYVPIGFAVRIDERDRAMLDDYRANGRDIAAVAKKFGVSVQTAYKRIRIVEQNEYRDRQGGLFDQGT